MSRIATELIERIRTRRARVGAVGIPVDPLYLSWKAKQHGFEPRFVSDAVVAQASVVVDRRNAVKQPHAHVFKLGAPNRAHADVWPPEPEPAEVVA